MNPLIEIASGILYLVFRICTLPGLLALYLFIILWTVLRHLLQVQKKLVKSISAYRRGFQYPQKRNLDSLLPRWIRFQ